MNFRINASSKEMIILRPKNINNNSLQIGKDSFTNLPFNIFMEGFDWKLSKLDSKISFYK